MRDKVIEYLNKKYKIPFEVVSYEEIDKKYIRVELDFGDGDPEEILISHRKGDNGNFRIVLA